MLIKSFADPTVKNPFTITLNDRNYPSSASCPFWLNYVNCNQKIL